MNFRDCSMESLSPDVKQTELTQVRFQCQGFGA